MPSDDTQKKTITPETSPGYSQTQKLLWELRTTFLVELPDRLDDIESLVLNLEQDQTSVTPEHPVYDALYRHLHSLKGGAGIHGVSIISLISHQFEDLLTELGNGLTLNLTLIDTFLEYVDLTRQATQLALENNTDFDTVKSALETIRSRLKQGRKMALIIEESNFMVNLYQDSLRSLPVDIAVIGDGLEALGWLLREKYDLVIMSAETKTLNGTALLYALRAAGGINRDIKTIIVTSRKHSHFIKDMHPDALLNKNKTLASQLKTAVSRLFTF